MDPSRTFVRDVKRVVIKVGTAVVTRADGKLAVGRLGWLCEQVQALMSEQIDVIFVTSGAVGVGRQKLKHQHLLNSSFKDLHNDLHQLVLDGKACAAVGQSGLMALYESLFSQLGVEQAQLLVTDRDFKDVDFRHQLSSTVNALLAHRVVPIFNENDAISTRKAPYKDATGIFWDNDSLAALLALELKADLLILLSDVEGLYTGPPSDPQSQLIHTYLKEKHENTVTFGEKSRVGRGGMTAKVFAAWNAASAGIPVVITSGYATDGIERVMRGERVGTLFHNKAQDLVALKEAGARDMAVAARDASRRLQGLSSAERRDILLNVAAALEANEEVIRQENEADVAAAIQARISQPLVDRLTIKPGKIRSLASSIRLLAEMEEPLGQLLKQTEIAKDLVLQKTACPLGVVLVIFESRPDALVQIASLAIRSGNGLLLKGGKEAARSNAVLHKVITEAISEPVGPNLIGLVTSRDEVPDLLKLDDVIDLVIPRGSNQLVTQIKSLTKIPVLGHADGVCHVYLDKAIDWAKAQKIVLDSKVDYPSACNAMETLLVHEELVESSGLQLLVVALQEKGVQIYGGKRASEVMQLPLAADLHQEYSSLACTLEIVENVEAAINHIHENGSAHTDCVITEDPAVAAAFLNGVDSAVVIHDASTRFCDGARFGLGAEVGISTSRIHARGPVGVEGLLTTRWLVKGCGQVVDGDRGVVYTHKDLGVKAASNGTANGTATGTANGKTNGLSNGTSHVKSHITSNGNVLSNGAVQ